MTGAVTQGEGFIEPADRIAVFDNDGTLWIEQPLPVQLDFIFRALAEAAQKDTSLALCVWWMTRSRSRWTGLSST